MSCLVDRDDDYGCTEIKQKTVKARKTHWCGECLKLINPGDEYEIYVGAMDGSIFREKTCLVCVELRGHFCCGWQFGVVLSDIDDKLRESDGTLSLGCLDGLSPAACDVIANMLEEIWAEDNWVQR